MTKLREEKIVPAIYRCDVCGVEYSVGNVTNVITVTISTENKVDFNYDACKTCYKYASKRFDERPLTYQQMRLLLIDGVRFLNGRRKIKGNKLLFSQIEKNKRPIKIKKK